MTGFDTFGSVILNFQGLLAAVGAGGKGESSTLEALLFTLLPLVIMAVIIWFFFRRGVKGSQDKYMQYLQRHEQHMERVEQTMERIAAALEKKNSASGGS